jgi:CubicO group peptidase (beta-lactamase class C family)
VSGKSWGDFVEERIMEPLEMNHSAASFVRLKDSTNIIAPHVPINGKLKVIKRYQNQLLMLEFKCERFKVGHHANEWKWY